MTTEGFFDKIQYNLHYSIPLSVIRYGDGETMMLDNKVEDTNFILKKVLGYIPNEEDIINMKANLIEAYIDCDMLGIPTERHLKRADNWQKSLDVFKRVIGDEILKVKLHTSIDIFYDLLSENYYEKLFNGLDTLNYISCRNLDDRFKERFNIKNVNSYIISPEPTYVSGYIGKKHYPEQFFEIEEWVKTINCKGKLCLVGAGIPGKIYNNWFRDQGGISLDVGSVFDFWAGYRTRGKGRGLDAIDNTHKL